MKRILEFVFLTALAVLALSCAGDMAAPRPVVPEELDGTTFTGKIGTRSGDAEGYPFRLYALPSGATTWGGFVINDAKAYLDMTSNLISTSMQWPLDNSQLLLVGAMKAGDGGTAASAVSTVDVTPAGLVQLAAGAGYNYDILLSNNLTARKSDLTKEMAFRHLMTQLIIRLRVVDEIDTECNVTGLVEAGKATASYPVLTSDAATTVTGAGTYNINYTETIRNGVAAPEPQVFHLIPDGGKILKIAGVEVNGIASGDITLYDSGNTAAEIELLPGVSYTVTLTVNKRGLATAELTLSPWLEETLSLGAIEGTAKEMLLLWDAAGADVTSIEIVKADNTILASQVTKDASVAGKGYLSFPTDVTFVSTDKIFAYRNNVRVEMVSPKADASKLWSFTAATADDPAVLEVKRVLVETPEQLRAIDDEGEAAGNNKHHYQVADIDLSAYANWTPICAGNTKPFWGSYVGGGFKINNLKINNPTGYYLGLFCFNGGLIKGVHVASGSVTVGYYSAVICGYNFSDAVVSDCTNEASLNTPAYYVGAIVGSNFENGAVTGCVNRGKISGTGEIYAYIAGIVGYNDTECLVSDCVNYGEINATGNAVAGVVAFNIGAVIKCTNRGNVTGGREIVGGVVATSSDTASPITECYNYGTVKSTYNVLPEGFERDPDYGFYSYIGGICGQNTGASAYFDNCENRGTVSAKGLIAGGIVGYSAAQITNCTNRGSIEAMGYSAGIAGWIANAAVTSNCNNYGTITGTGDYYLPGNFGLRRSSYTAGIAGVMSNSDISDCNNYGTIDGCDCTAGIAGILKGSNASNCHNYAVVKGRQEVGGIAGYLDRDHEISGCTNNAEINCTRAFNQAVGGICGRGYAGIISNCRNNSAVTGNSSVGGICGDAAWVQLNEGDFMGLVDNCTNAAPVTAVGNLNYYEPYHSYYRGGHAGGIAGRSGSRIVSCSNTATASVKSGAQRAGGIVGLNQGVVFSSSNAATVAADSAYVGGIVGQQMVGLISVNPYEFYDSNTGVLKSWNTGNVIGNMDYVGGIIGGGGAPVLSSYNTGNIIGDNYVGGICGEFAQGNYLIGADIGVGYNSVLACYNTGRVAASGKSAGGICGSVQTYNLNEIPYRVEACYNIGAVSGSSNVGAIVGELMGYNTLSNGIPYMFNTLPIEVKYNYWAGTSTLNAVGNEDTGRTASDIIDNHSFTTAWPTFDAVKFWGEGDNPDDGEYWRSLGSVETTYPKLFWE